MTTDLAAPPSTVPAVHRAAKTSLIQRFAERYEIEPAKVLDTLKATCFKTDKPVTNEQMAALLIVAERYGLDPFTKELFAFPDRSGIVPVVSVDGWVRIINERPQLDGISFEYEGLGTPDMAITCTIFRKDRAHPIRVTEFLAECKRNTEPWNKSPRRMLRHKALIQCARVAFGFAGIYDEDEARRIVDGGTVERIEPASASAERVRAALLARSEPLDELPIEPEVIEHEPSDAAPPPAAPHEAPKTYAKFVHEVLHASDGEIAGLVLDEARTSLPAPQHAELVQVYSSKWHTKE
jgi:phage recombination protein Bet